MARRSDATASFSARRWVRVRVSECLGKCEIFGRRAPTFRSLGFAYGFIFLIPQKFRRESRSPCNACDS